MTSKDNFIIFRGVWEVSGAPGYSFRSRHWQDYLGKQLIRSATSIGANLEEADAASSRKDFLHKVSIAYKEARESRYWLEIALESDLLNHQSNVSEAKTLQAEAVELSKILYSIRNPKKM